jgi:hypothetical protein
MKTFRALAVLGFLFAASPVSAQPEGMNNSAGGGSSIPGSMGSGTAANSPPEEKPGVGSSSTPGAARASAMGTPTPGGGADTTGHGATGLPPASSGER